VHSGIDVQAVEGSPVHSPVASTVGKVWRNGELNRYGNLLVLHTSDAKSLVFAHLRDAPARANGALLREGDALLAGEQVGIVGRTGACKGWPRRPAATGPHGVPCTNCGAYLCSGSHLHFEVRPGTIRRPNPYGPSLDPSGYASQQGFAITSAAGLGAYVDPLEPGEDWTAWLLARAPQILFGTAVTVTSVALGIALWRRVV
jgi:murein DD-endopeptidase MepM/ murein hydrolase activator NlpD